MAKRRRQTEEAEEPREEAPIVGRESFLPEPPAPEAPVIAEARVEGAENGAIPNITITVKRVTDIQLEVSMAIEPLDGETRSNVISPRNGTIYDTAHHIAAAISDMARSLAYAAEAQKAIKANEEREARKRFMSR